MKKIMIAVVAAVLAAAASELTRRAIRRTSHADGAAGGPVDVRGPAERLEAKDLVFDADPGWPVAVA